MTHRLPLRVIWYRLTWQKNGISLYEKHLWRSWFFLRYSHKKVQLNSLSPRASFLRKSWKGVVTRNIWCPSVLMELLALRWICFLIKCSLQVSKWGILCLWKRINCYLPLGIVYPRPPWGERIGRWRTPSLPIVSMQRKGKVLVAFDNQFQHSAGLAISHAS